MPNPIREFFGIFSSDRRLRESGTVSDPNRSLIRYERKEIESNLDKQQDGESSSFDEAFIDYIKQYKAESESVLKDSDFNREELIREVFKDDV